MLWYTWGDANSSSMKHHLLAEGTRERWYWCMKYWGAHHIKYYTRTHAHTHEYTCTHTHTCLQICIHAHTHITHTTHRGCFFSTIFTVKLVETVTSSEQMWTSEHSGIPSYWQQEKVRAISFNVMLIGRLSWNWGAFLKPFSNKKDDNIFIAKDNVSFCEMGCEEWIYCRNDSNIPSLKWTASLCQTWNLSFLKSNLRTYVL